MGAVVAVNEIYSYVGMPGRMSKIDQLHAQGHLSDADLATLIEAADEIKVGRLTVAAVWRWLNSKDGVAVSVGAVSNWMAKHDR